MTTSQTGEPSKRIIRFVHRTMQIVIVLVVGFMIAFSNVSASVTTAQAPDSNMLEAIARISEILSLQSAQKDLSVDVRAEHIEAYFVGKGNLPAKDYAKDFVLAADKYNLDDWRLVAAISMIETTGCRYTVENHAYTSRLNNCLGWGSASFESIPHGIDYVTSALAGVNEKNGHHYANKTMSQKIQTYNSVIEDYEETLLGFMDKIYPDELMNQPVIIPTFAFNK